MENVDRFSDRAQDYTRYRPHYPQEIIDFLHETVDFSKEWVVADIGSGTGISSEYFLKFGNTVYAIEPNKPMREEAEKTYDGLPNFISINGTAESTSLDDNSIDLIMAGQAFHWFAGPKAKLEFRRIAKRGSHILLMWNERDLASPLQQEYEKLLIDLAVDYTDVCQRNIDEERIKTFFAPQHYTMGSMAHAQHLDLQELEGRLMSSSYAPLANHPNHQPMMKRLHQLFGRFQKDGRIEFPYLCKLYLGPVGK